MAAFPAISAGSGEAVGLLKLPSLLVCLNRRWCSDDRHKTKSNADAASSSQDFVCEGHGFGRLWDFSRTPAPSPLVL